MIEIGLRCVSLDRQSTGYLHFHANMGDLTATLQLTYR